MNFLRRSGNNETVTGKSEKSKSAIEQQFGPLQIIEVGPKRVLTYRVFGAPLSKGVSKVVLYHHGVPSCHLEGATFAECAAEKNVSVLAIDRPGIGGSTYQRQLSLASFSEDCNTVLDSLGVGHVIVIGNSGGAPYAVGFAVCYPARTDVLGLIAGLAPTDWSSKEHRENLRSMKGFDRFQMGAARGPTAFVGTPILWLAHKAMRYMANNMPDVLLEYAPKGMAPVDGDLMVTDPRVRDSFASVLQHAYSGSGARGVGRDVKVLGRAWGFDAADVRCRTLIWHGSEDESVPVSHAQYYASQIKDSELIVLEGEGHLTLPVRHAGTILESLIAAADGHQLNLKQNPSLRSMLSVEDSMKLATLVSRNLEDQAQHLLEAEGYEPSEAGDSVSSEEGEGQGDEPSSPCSVPSGKQVHGPNAIQVGMGAPAGEGGSLQAAVSTTGPVAAEGGRSPDVTSAGGSL